MAQSPAVNLRRGGSWGGGEGNVFKGRGRGGGWYNNAHYGVSIFADIFKILTMFIKTIFRNSK